MTRFLALFFFLSTFPLTAHIAYHVEYRGLNDPSTLKIIQSRSSLSTKRKNPPESLHALRFRAEADIPEIIKILHSRGYLEASVYVEVQETSPRSTVYVHIDTGQAYVLESFTYTFTKSLSIDIAHNMHVGNAFIASAVIQEELSMLQELAQCGYPLASITHRSIIADGDTKSVRMHLDIDQGPLCTFGPVTIQGAQHVKSAFFYDRMPWKEGDIYDERMVAKMQKVLMDAGLFSSVIIKHPLPPNEEGSLPLCIEVTESKHKSLFGGVSYQTYYGLGATFGWENNNVTGLGRTLQFQGDITKRSHTGLASYTITHFLTQGQDAILEAEATHLHILPYLERSYHLGGRLEKRLWEQMRLSIGLEGERLLVNASVDNGNYWIVESPLFIGIQGADDILNPTKGYQFAYTMTPSYVISPGSRVFLAQKGSISHYLPIDSRRIFVLAQQLSGAIILSTQRHSVPVPKRLFGGSEEDMRGYAYYSVSPLHDQKPIGGMSAFFYTCELRWRLSSTLGLVPFFDTGAVPIKDPLRSSLGLGIRYFSFMGPFRLDVAFPLEPRKGIDSVYKILVSIGQTF